MSKGAGSKVQHAFELISGPRAENTQRIIDRYAEWARDPEAFEARALLLAALFDEENIPVKLSSVLAAVERDTTPPEDDPLWSHVVELLAQVWQGETLSPGLDLMVAESRPRARQALIASFAHLVNTDTLPPLTPAQSQTLTNYFIDLYGQLPRSQQPEVSTALRKMAGNDVADILLGKGVTSDDELEGQREYKRALEESQRALAQAQEEPSSDDSSE